MENSTMFNDSRNLFENYSTIFPMNDSYLNMEMRDSFYLVIPVTLIYGIILIVGCIGNISTCIVISKNKSMYSATNYYLFSLAVSDFMLLVSGVPMELYHIWFPHEYMFGDYFCIIRNMLNEMSANATVLTITAFTIERYFAICHPFLAHKMSKLSRAVKYIFLIWILSISFAIPQALQTGLVVQDDKSWCTVVGERVLIEHSFELATLFFFFAPMSLITVLYILIGIKLRSSTIITKENGGSVHRKQNSSLTANIHQSHSTCQSSKRVIKMLVAVVICFFVCWAPFHAQRLAYTWAMNHMVNTPIVEKIFIFMTYISGILYYVSTCINPILYNLMSNKFRQAFKKTLHEKCCNRAEPKTDSEKHEYRMLSRHGKRRFIQHESSEYSGSGRDDYSSSHKQSFESMTMSSRNTSVKHLKMGKVETVVNRIENSRSTFSRNYVIGEQDQSSTQTSCLSAEISKTKIQVSTDGNLNGICLNIFPLEATRNSDGIRICNNDVSPLQKYLEINVHEKISDDVMTLENNRRRMSSGHFSFIKLKKCDSLLHITIGNSSKIAKRRKRVSWLFSRIMSFPKRNAKNRERKFSYDTHLNKHGCLTFESNGKMNLMNDELLLSIHNKSSSSTSFEMAKSNSENDDSIKSQMGRKFLKSLSIDEIENGANELDLYMNEIKCREMKRQI